MCGFIPGLSIFFPFVYISVFVPVPYSLDDCSFVVEPEVRQLIPSVPFFFLKIALAIQCFCISVLIVKLFVLLLLLLLSHFSRLRLCTTPQTAAYQAPPSLRFSR